MSKVKESLQASADLLSQAAERCEFNAAINSDEGQWAQQNLNDKLAKAYREGAKALEKAAK